LEGFYSGRYPVSGSSGIYPQRKYTDRRHKGFRGLSRRLYAARWHRQAEGECPFRARATPTGRVSAEAEDLLGGLPVRRDGVLRRGQLDPAVADGGVQGVLALVFGVRRGRVLRPEVGGVVGAAEFQRDQMVELGLLRLGLAVGRI